MASWQVSKPLPQGLRVSGEMVPLPAGSLALLTDVTAATPQGDSVSRQSIHAATLAMIRDAERFLVLDFFLFNDQGGPAGPLRYERGLHHAAGTLATALRDLKLRQPQLPVLLIVDPINDYYRGSAPPALAALQSQGVDVVVTRLDPLRDSNPVYSAGWRLLAKWWLDSSGSGSWTNRLDAAGPDVPLGSLLRIPNFKANHRKVIITGSSDGTLRGIVSSGNPHDASSAHSNVALQLAGEALRPLLHSEIAIARFSGWQGREEDFIGSTPRSDAPGASNTSASAQAAAAQAADARVADAMAAIVTEGAIRDRLLQRLAATGRGDAIDMAMFYLSDRQVIRALIAASRRGATVRVLLDPNKDAFGFEKSGIPNRQVAAELIAASDGAIRLRWFRTHGEQFHVKLTAVRSGGRLWMTLGSANFTRRNLGDYNLEANVIAEVADDTALARDVAAWFGMLWSNGPGALEYSADAELYAEPGMGRYWLYRFMEASGFSTF